MTDGRFVVVYQSGDGTDGPLEGGPIRARLFNADGTAVGLDFKVNSITVGGKVQPAVTALDDGRFMVTWTHTAGGSSAGGTDGSGTAIRARIFNADGTADGADFIVNTTTLSGQDNPAIAVLSDGRALVAWTSNDGGDGAGTLIRSGTISFNQPPVITSDLGGNTAIVAVDENTVLVTDVDATDP